MSHDRRFENLALVGFMGTGKSTVGHIVAAMLHFDFVDTDDMIEHRAGKRVSDIFSEQGETQFRLYEQQIVEELKTRTKAIISTGGGLVVNPANMESLKRHSLVVSLWASPNAILGRVAHQSHRPLLQGSDPLQKITDLLKERGPSYRKADVLLSSELRSPREVAHHIVHQFLALPKPNKSERAD